MKTPYLLISIILVVSAVALISLLPTLIHIQLDASELIGSLAMQSDSIEEVREFGGLLLVVSWMSVLLMRSHRTSTND